MSTFSILSLSTLHFQLGFFLTQLGAMAVGCHGRPTMRVPYSSSITSEKYAALKYKAIFQAVCGDSFFCRSLMPSQPSGSQCWR